MVTLVSDIIRDAYRESNLISIGTEPSGAQRREAIRFINRLIPSVLGYEAGENLETVYVDGVACVDASNVRLVLNNTTPLVVTLPCTTADGVRFAIVDPQGRLEENPVTIEGGNNTIEGEASITFYDPGSTHEYFYRADLGNWQKVSPVEETDEWPFPVEFDDMFIISLAFRLNPRYNIASQQESLMMLKRSERQFRARYKQTREVASDLALLNLTNAPTYNFNGFERGSV